MSCEGRDGGVALARLAMMKAEISVSVVLSSEQWWGHAMRALIALDGIPQHVCDIRMHSTHNHGAEATKADEAHTTNVCE